jgi:arginase
MTRREFALAAASLAAASKPGRGRAAATTPVSIIGAPITLGLRPNEAGLEPGTWQAPEVLLQTGLADRLGASVLRLERPSYAFLPQFGTSVRNGLSIRQFSMSLGDAVASEIGKGRFPVVLGGDCSILLGCLLGARRAGGRGLVHVDGHSDFFHPGNYNPARRAGSAAGMDLALATGRGEQVLTRWPGDDQPLVADRDVVQVGERASPQEMAEAWADVLTTSFARLPIQRALAIGVPAAAAEVLSRLSDRGLARVWLHVDFDVLDEASLAAVDSPGSPGFTFDELSRFLAFLLASGRFVGADLAIYDPSLDPEHAQARRLADCVEHALNARNS